MELPEGCIANIIARTTPKDACRLCAVSKLFKSAADSDYVWGRFLPSDVVSLVSHSHSHSSLISLSTSNKSLYLALSDRPTVIDKGKMSFQLDKKSGKKCYMLAARALTIVWGDTPRYWEWIPLEESSLHTLYTIVSRLWASTALTSILSLAALFVFSLAASQLRRRSLCLTLRSASTAVAATTVMMETLSSFVASSPPPFSHFVLPLSSSGSNYISTAEATTDLTIGLVFSRRSCPSSTSPHLHLLFILLYLFLFFLLLCALFSEVARLEHVWWLEIRGVLSTLVLTPNTHYAAYLVFSMEEDRIGFQHCPVELSIGMLGGEASTKNVILDPESDGVRQLPNLRGNPWLEIEFGVFFVSSTEDEQVQMSVVETEAGVLKSGLIIEGIEFRPKEDN
ncbi:hypothetical protein Ahy_B02g059106 isoform A [Arachis hypogaea]|uniref:F-box domain-containing protein n=1 Tax=Arachis hypogaea TaxID=3818 RepID=A0A445AG26_ARAHY|nr:hypothetical protein Ahy_B02g059106 isoform A [Arachis hypogaea]